MASNTYSNLHRRFQALWLENNAIESLGTGLVALTQLRSLFLQQNCIRTIHGLENLVHLDTLNLSQNLLTGLSGLENLVALRTLNVSENQLSSIACLEVLTRCLSIQNLDLSQNKIGLITEDEDSEEEEDPWSILEIFAFMPDLKSLYIQENPITERLPRLRKNFLARLDKLSCLNNKAISEEERLCAEAWGRGGVEAERDERRRQLMDGT